MAAFVITEDSPLPPEQAWALVTDWPRHGAFVPLTSITVTPAGPSGVGTVFTARTALGPAGFDDPMEIVEWQPPSGDTGGLCRIEKRGKVMLGWAVLTVESLATGSRTTWREEVRPAHSPRFIDPVATLSSKMLFGRVMRKLLQA